jgi:hypothetical protein
MELISRGDEYLTNLSFGDARETFDAAYRLLLDAQPSYGRFDKAEPLLRRAIAERFWPQSDAASTRRTAILALIETLITKLETRLPARAARLDWSTARNAQALAYLPAQTVRSWAERLADRMDTPSDLREPERLADDLGIVEFLQIGAPSTGRPEPGMFEVPWSRRVFVGGSYIHHFADLNEICRIVREAGMTPVIAWDYDVPRGWAHHHSLMLLHECRHAVFEVSTPAGQLMELERCRDYGIDPLVVYQGNERTGRLPTMVADLLIRLGQTPRRYRDIGELDPQIKGYLTRPV